MRSLNVLVTDGHLRPSLAVVRSLARAGHRVYVCSPRARSLAGVSRGAVAEAQVPDPLADPEAFTAAVRELAAAWQVRVLMPMSEESLLVLLPVAEQMPGVCIPFPPLELFRTASDKEYVTSLAASLGIAVPEQVVVQRKEQAPALDESLRFPIVIKPARSVGGDGVDRQKFGVAYASDRAALERQLAALPASAFPVLLQQRIEGPGTGVFLLVWDGRVVAQFAHRRIREKPPTGGVSVCAESVVADPATVERSIALLEALHWRGVAMVEFKQDRTTGQRYLMEINGRFWGSLQLAIDAGVDFPALLVEAAMGERPQPVVSYQSGVSSRWWWGEVDHLIAQLRGRGTATGIGGRASAIGRFLFPGQRARNEVLRPSDPRPFLRETAEWFRGR